MPRTGELPQAPLADLADGLALTVYAQHAEGVPFECPQIPDAAAPAFALTCQDQFDYYLQRARHDNRLQASPKPLLLDPVGFAPRASFADPNQLNGVVEDSAAKVRAIEALGRHLALDPELAGWSWFKWLHKAEAAWGLVDRREIAHEGTTTTEHEVVLQDLFPDTEYVATLLADNGSYCELRFRSLGLSEPANQSPLVALTAPAYGVELARPGDSLALRWRDDDADDDASISLYYDIDDAG